MNYFLAMSRSCWRIMKESPMLEDLQRPKFSAPSAAPSDEPALGEGSGDSGEEANKPHPISVGLVMQLPDGSIYYDAENLPEFDLLDSLRAMGLRVGANAQVKRARSAKV